MVFKNKKDKFAVLLGNIAENLRESTNYFADYKLNDENDLKIFSKKMKEYESKGDNFVHEMILELNDAFITPIEREDLLALTNSLDDVLDGIEECAGLFEMYEITTADQYMVKFVDAIRNAVLEIEKALELMFNKKLPAMRDHAIKIKEYESKCDDVLRECIKVLFSTEKDPIQLIKYRDIYENLEEIADDCQSVANTLETIIMKNA